MELEMIFGDFSNFSVLECLKLMLGARFYVEHDGNRFIRCKIAFKCPSWLGKTIRTYPINEEN